ncbi:hypothetical protein SOVF_101020 [Spinacia oleracea]|nr:hypothetical protein SOVF_101020 [Spinacia oleracea]
MEKDGDRYVNNKPTTKVTLIETRSVEVEAKDFKSMVQSLTGKNCSVAWIGNDTYNASSNSLQNQMRKRPRMTSPPHQPPQQQPPHYVQAGNSGASVCLGANAAVVVDSMNAVDLDEMLQGLPLMEELYLESWSWNYVNNQQNN